MLILSPASAMPETEFSERNNMKKLFVLLSVAYACMSVVSCNNPLMDLDGTKWEVYMYEDRLNGKVVDTQFGPADVEFIGDRDNFQLSVKFVGDGKPTVYGPEDAIIVRCNSAELVFDLAYYEYDDIKKEDCEYELTYKGVKIYRYDDTYYGQKWSYYVYFKPNGIAVDVGAYTYDGEEYWYDSERLYCRRAL